MPAGGIDLMLVALEAQAGFPFEHAINASLPTSSLVASCARNGAVRSLIPRSIRIVNVLHNEAILLMCYIINRANGISEIAYSDYRV